MNLRKNRGSITIDASVAIIALLILLPVLTGLMYNVNKTRTIIKRKSQALDLATACIEGFKVYGRNYFDTLNLEYDENLNDDEISNDDEIPKFVNYLVKNSLKIKLRNDDYYCSECVVKDEDTNKIIMVNEYQKEKTDVWNEVEEKYENNIKKIQQYKIMLNIEDSNDDEGNNIKKLKVKVCYYTSNGKYKYVELESAITKKNDTVIVDDEENTVLPTDWIYDSETFSYTKGNMTVKIGDYVNYSSTLGTEEKQYTSKADLNGYLDRTFVSDYTGTWQILGRSDDGKWMILSSSHINARNSSTNKNTLTYYLKGEKGFLNGMSELDAISKIYGYGTYAESARSINIEDINKLTGYVDNKYKKDSNVVAQTGNEVTYYKASDGYIYCKGSKYPTLDNHGTLTWSGENGVKSSYNTFRYLVEDEFASLENNQGVTLKNDYYEYYLNTLSTNQYEDDKNITSDSNIYKLLYNSVVDYWIASRFTYTISIGKVHYGLRAVSGNNVRCYDLAYSNEISCNSFGGVRPVVILESTVLLGEGNGTSSSPWILGYE